MTDDTTAADRAERIRRLQERRAATSSRTVAATTSSNDVTASTGTRPTGTRTAKPKRRKHAVGTRFLLAGMSVASFLGIAGSIALANGGTPAAVPTPVAAAPAPTPVAATPATATASATPAQAANTGVAAKAGAASSSAPHVTTRGS